MKPIPVCKHGLRLWPDANRDEFHEGDVMPCADPSCERGLAGQRLKRWVAPPEYVVAPSADLIIRYPREYTEEWERVVTWQGWRWARR